MTLDLPVVLAWRTIEEKDQTTMPRFADNAVADIPLSTDEDGVIRIGSSGVALESVLAYYREGATAEEIADSFPSIERPDLHYVLGYSLRHSDEVDDYMARRAAEEARLRDDVERQFDVSALKVQIERRRQGWITRFAAGPSGGRSAGALGP